MGRAGEPASPTRRGPTSAGSLVVWRGGDGALTARMTSAAGVTTVSSLGAGSDARLVAGGRASRGPGDRPRRRTPPGALRAGHGTWSDGRRLARPGRADDRRPGPRPRLPAGGRRKPGGGRRRAPGRPHRRPLPAARSSNPTRAPSWRCRARRSGARTASRGHVAALARRRRRRAGGHPTTAAAAVTDLQTGASVSLGGYTRIVAATVGGDGSSTSSPGAPTRPSRCASCASTRARCASCRPGTPGVAARPRSPASALPTRFGAVFYLPGVPHSLDAYSGTNIWLVDGGGARQNSAVSSNVGVRMGPGARRQRALLRPPRRRRRVAARHRRRRAEPGFRPAQRAVGRDRRAGR